MPDLRFTKKDPFKGYITNNLLIPKKKPNGNDLLNPEQVKQSLTFIIGEEDVIEEDTGEIVGRQPHQEKLWNETEHHLIVPRCYLSTEQLAQLKCEWVVERLESIHVNVPNKIVPRDTTQRRALRKMRHHKGGTVNIACGKGKTIIALKYWAERHVPALIVVNTSALVHQWMLEIEEFFGSDVQVGHIQGKTCIWEDCPITIAMVHTLANKSWEWSAKFRRYFGIIFYDEGHHLSAPHFCKSASLFFGERFSLTATATRTDGLEAIYQYHLGDIIYVDLEQELIPNTLFHSLAYYLTHEDDRDCRDINGQMCHPKICGTLGRMDWRNDLIIDNLSADLEEGRECLVLTHSVDHTRELYRLIVEAGYEGAGLINGQDTSPFDRIPVLRDSNPVIGTFQLAREALNKPILDTLHITTPFGNSNDLQQAWGRIQRVRAAKMSLRVRVYEDEPIKTCREQCTRLRKYLRAMDYPWEKTEESA